MGFRSLWEALKIDKAPDTKTNRAALLLLFIIAAALYLTEPLQAPVLEFYSDLEAFLLRGQGFPFPSNDLIITLLKQFVLNAVSCYFILFSALNYLEYKGEEKETSNISTTGLEVDITLPRTLRDFSTRKIACKYYPYILVLALAMLGLRILSVFAMNIPYYIIASMLSMTLLEQIYEERGVFQAMEASAALTKGFRFYIFVQFFLLSSILSLAENLLLNVLASSLWAGSLIRAFLHAWLAFAMGRLAGISYKTTRLLHTSLNLFRQGRF